MDKLRVHAKRVKRLLNAIQSSQTTWFVNSQSLYFSKNEILKILKLLNDFELQSVKLGYIVGNHGLKPRTGVLAREVENS